jgi:hypothetical protein
MSDLDPDTKARIEAEERYRQEVRASSQGATQTPVTNVANTTVKPKKKTGCGTWILYGIIGLIALVVIANLSGGDKTPNNSSISSNTTTVPPETSNAVETPQENSGDGEAQSDGSQNIGVWNISTNSWDETDNVGGEFGESAGEGEKFIVVSYTLKNTTNKTQNFSTLIEGPKLILSDGSIIDEDTMLSIQSSDKSIDGQIAPGLKREGNAAFRIPSGKADGAIFQMQFFNGKTASFKLSSF